MNRSNPKIGAALPLSTRRRLSGFNCGVVFLLMITTASTQAQDSQQTRKFREVSGVVVDASNKPVANAEIAVHWSANGPMPAKDSAGNAVDFSKADGFYYLTSHKGEMAPYFPKQSARTDQQGRFTLSVPSYRNHLMVFDNIRQNGAVVILHKRADLSKIKVQLMPGVWFRGHVAPYKSGEPIDYWYVNVRPPRDPSRPLDHTWLAFFQSASVQSGKKRLESDTFEMWLPPGQYQLDIRALRDGKNGGVKEARVLPIPKLHLDGKSRQIQIGEFRFSTYRPLLPAKIATAKAAGTWDDYTKHYGEPAPRWHVADARGLKKDVQISDLKGKWVLLYFWNRNCVPCMRTGIPNLIKFYSEHDKARDRFEIISFVVDDDELTSIADLDKKMAPVVKNVWGQLVPFPTLLDPSFKTWEQYGLSAFGTTVLIDPQGRLIEGDETDLAEKLK